jgi:hypothetical protein
MDHVTKVMGQQDEDEEDTSREGWHREESIDAMDVR